MKTKLISFGALLCMMAMICSCCEKVEPENPSVKPPIEEPENPDKPEKPDKPEEKPSTEDIINIQINDEIMAIVGTDDWKDITYGNGKYVVVGSNGSIAYSADGVNWTQKTLWGAWVNWYGIAYGNGKFVAVCKPKQGVYDSTYAYSTDGINWTVKTEPNTFADKVNYLNGKFYIYEESSVKYSTDGVNWTKVSITPAAGGTVKTYGNGQYVGVSNFGKYWHSSDGINWTCIDVEKGLYPGGCIAFGNGKFVAGNNLNQNIAYSTDGINWKTKNITANFRDIAYKDGYFVAVGANGVHISSDAIEWTKVNSTIVDGWDICIMQ